MLDRLDLDAYRCFHRESIALERFTLFVGANASGKSTVLNAIERLARLPGWLASPQQPATDPLLDHRTGGRLAPLWVPGTVAITAHRRDEQWTIKGQVKDDRCIVDTMPRWSNDPAAASQRLRPIHAMMLRFEASKLGQPHIPSVAGAGLSVDGSGLASAIADLALEQPQAKAQVEAQLERLVPQVRGVRSRKRVVRTQSVAADLSYEQTEFYLEANIAERGWVPAADLSEGTLLLLGLLTVLHAPTAPSLVLIDDLDRGLHPSAQRELAGLLQGLLHQRPELQIIATTHSPFLLDMVEDTQVRVLAIDVDGRARCRALSDHPEAARWRDQLRAGEFWSFVGESWVRDAER